MPGVVDIPQGAWYEPDENGVDRGGCVNVLTSHHWTPFAFASTQHTIMVEVRKEERENMDSISFPLSSGSK
jgi:anaerobic dimethyl sulfoxide reductase subunit A